MSFQIAFVSDGRSISIHQIRKTCIGNKHFYEHQNCFDKSISFNYHKIRIERLNGAGKTALISICMNDEEVRKTNLSYQKTIHLNWKYFSHFFLKLTLKIKIQKIKLM